MLDISAPLRFNKAGNKIGMKKTYDFLAPNETKELEEHVKDLVELGFSVNEIGTRLGISDSTLWHARHKNKVRRVYLYALKGLLAEKIGNSPPAHPAAVVHGMEITSAEALCLLEALVDVKKNGKYDVSNLLKKVAAELVK